ncbi:hypothetical protein AW736_11060 [Termitidicoccus mucosus]|uniref:Uncharacterized protein n=1 Tax=Termitidicoccus mucosus TaxID=1184151 RepID=A0A178IJI1_9BACT|nr:hypothetical protein AW736_11060 [Opitutaceae bacterium TSB47]
MRLTEHELALFSQLAENSGLQLSEIVRRLLHAAVAFYAANDAWPREIEIAKKTKPTETLAGKITEHNLSELRDSGQTLLPHEKGKLDKLDTEPLDRKPRHSLRADAAFADARTDTKRPSRAQRPPKK